MNIERYALESKFDVRKCLAGFCSPQFKVLATARLRTASVGANKTVALPGVSPSPGEFLASWTRKSTLSATAPLSRQFFFEISKGRALPKEADRLQDGQDESQGSKVVGTIEAAEAGVQKEAKPVNGTLCILSGDTVDDPEKEAEELQAKVIEQLKFAQAIFPALALARIVEVFPEFLDPTASRWEEVMDVVSAVDPLLVGLFAYGTANGLQEILDKEKCKQESLEFMRRSAMENLVNFFERANLVVFGVAFATFSRVVIQRAAGTDFWGQMMENMLELQEVVTGMFELLASH